MASTPTSGIATSSVAMIVKNASEASLPSKAGLAGATRTRAYSVGSKGTRMLIELRAAPPTFVAIGVYVAPPSAESSMFASSAPRQVMAWVAPTFQVSPPLGEARKYRLMS